MPAPQNQTHLTGKYEEPSFMSKESSLLIKSMLQVDPKKRITIEKLLSHRWLTLNILDPVVLRSENVKGYDAQCVEKMAGQNRVNKEAMWNHLKKWKYDYHTATYLLLMSKKRRGSSLKLANSCIAVPVEGFKEISLTRKTVLKNTANAPYNFPNEDVGRESTPSKNVVPTTPVEKTNHLRVCADGTPDNGKFDQENSFVEPNRPSTIRKALKRIRSPGTDDGSPVPAKRAPVDPATPVNTPDRKLSTNTPDTVGSTRRVFGSIERSFHRVVNVLTPRKSDEAVNARPTVLTAKNMCNVSTTPFQDPELAISHLSKSLQGKGVVCKRKGFTLRGKLERNVIDNLGECSFELEICYVPHLGPPLPTFPDTPIKSILKKGPLNFDSPVKNNVPVGENKSDRSDVSKNIIGIRRKRLKGDSWCYKKVCEEVLAMASDIKITTEPQMDSMTESSV